VRLKHLWWWQFKSLLQHFYFENFGVYQLYDAGNLPLEFNAKIRDVISFDDDIYRITSFEKTMMMVTRYRQCCDFRVALSSLVLLFNVCED
jgi:hypothetical protein